MKPIFSESNALRILKMYPSELKPFMWGFLMVLYKKELNFNDEYMNDKLMLQ